MHGYKLIRETAPLISHELLKELTPPQLCERVSQLRQSIVTKLMQHSIEAESVTHWLLTITGSRREQ